MSDDEDGYCRLCAEPTPLVQLIAPDEDVMFTSKVQAKLSWININILSAGLPKTICFSCFDLLERTWTFLNNVRTAQEKLKTIFLKKPNHNKTLESDNNTAIIGKPVDKDWEDFQRPKVEVKIESLNDSSDKLHRNTIIISDDLSGDNDVIKTEEDSENYLAEPIHCQYTSSDSDVPLKKVTKKKKLKRKRKKDSIKVESENEVPIDILPFITWENQTCRCAKCNALCKSILSLQLHSLEIHNQCCIFKCIDCEKVVSTYRSFIRHIRTHNSSLRHCCEYCYKIFLDIKSHKLKEHKDVYKTKCTNCGASFETAEQLEEHKSMFYKDEKKTKKYKLKSKVEEQSDFKCEDCNKTFKSRPYLQQHKLLHTERIRNFSCHVCGKMFYTKGSLGTHMVTHEEVKPFKCDHCPLAFRARGNLISHLSLHTGLKPFICEQCGKSFRVKRHLMSHAIVHTDLRPYVCEYCNKAFRFKTRLNLHLRQHTGVKPYKCIYCQRDFTNGSNYKKHMSRRHGIDTSTRLKINKIVNKETLNGSEIAT